MSVGMMELNQAQVPIDMKRLPRQSFNVSKTRTDIILQECICPQHEFFASLTSSPSSLLAVHSCDRLLASSGSCCFPRFKNLSSTLAMLKAPSRFLPLGYRFAVLLDKLTVSVIRCTLDTPTIGGGLIEQYLPKV